MSKLIPSNMAGLVGTIVQESAPVHLKNEGYGFLGTLHGPDAAKRDHLHKIVPHAKAALEHGLAKHQAQDALHRKHFGIKTTAQDKRAKMKVTNKTVGHFLDSSHGRHIADALNSGARHHENPGALASRAHHFMRDYDSKLHESIDDGSSDVSLDLIERDENHNINAARSIHHAILQSKGIHSSSPEYIKLMQDFLAGYKNGSSIAEQYEIAEAKEVDGVWVVAESVMLLDESKISGKAESETHKLAQKHVRTHGEALRGTIHNLDHNEDGSSTWHIRHSPPHTEKVVKVLRDVRYAHDQGVRDRAGEVLNSKTSAPNQPSIHIKTNPLAGGWYNTQVHFKPKKVKLKEDGSIDETAFYDADDGAQDPNPLPDANTDVTTPAAMQQDEAAPSKPGSPAMKLTTEAPILDADTDVLPEPRDGDQTELPSGIAERVEHGSLAQAGIMHAHQAAHMQKGRNHAYFHPKTGRQTDGEVVHKGKSEIHMRNTYDGQTHKFRIQSSVDEEVFVNDILDEEFNSHEQASTRKEYLDKKHPRTVHEVVQGRRSGKYFIVRKNQHGAHVAEAVCFPDLESGGATQTMKTYDDPTKAIGEDAGAKSAKVNKIKSIVHSSKE